MTEQIIINGVDVSRCPKIVVTPDTVICKYYLLQCKLDDNCLYKQLQRKTAECEELNNKLQIATEALERIRYREIESFDMTEAEYEIEFADTEFSDTLTDCEKALERIKE